MDKFIIGGGKRLVGEVTASGAKNAAVAIIPAAILSDGIVRIENVPNISDVSLITRIIASMGAEVRFINKSCIEVNSRGLTPNIASYEMVRRMRASYYLLGAMLGKFNMGQISMPGGCDFGVRPIDQHLKGFSALGATCELIDGGIIRVQAKQLKGAHIYLDVVSVGATMNVMLAAVKAKGMTVIENAAREPHIVDLANFLNSMGADVRGAGTDTIKIRGVSTLRGATYSIIPDQIEAGTYMVMAAATGGDVLIKNVIPKHLESITAKLLEMGVSVTEYDDSIRVRRDGDLERCNIKTMPHPGFPTDMQPQMSVLLSMARGTSIVTEGVWDNRFRYVDELHRLGAQVSVDGKIAVFEGVEKLRGARIKAVDLRAGAAMLIAGLAAEGTTEIEDIHHIERGYEDIEEKLRDLGADIQRVSEKPVDPLKVAL